jgi:formyl-CoA transferase
MGKPQGILHGIRVVEAATMVMVPAVGAVLAEYGAEVIKIEPPEGDLNRHGHKLPGLPTSDLEYAFYTDNRNKKSIVVDLKTEQGRGILYRLVDDADIFLTNYRPVAQRRLQLGWEHLKKRNPRLIYAHGTGYGDTGAETDKPGFDTVCYWARSGIEGHMFPIEGYLTPAPYGAGDHPSGMSLFAAVMLALFNRERTGKGCRVSSSLLANGAWSNSVLLQARFMGATFHPKRPRADAFNFTGVYYRTSDNRLLRLSVVNVEQGWPRICRALGRADLIHDPRYATRDARSGRMGELISICDEIFARHDMAYWKKTLEEHDIPAGIVSNLNDAAEDEQMRANGVFIDVQDAQLGTVRSVTSPIQIDGLPKVPPLAAPRLGEHSREILAQLGLDETEIEGLVGDGVVVAN